MKKVLSLALALIMVCALSLGVFAEEAVYTMTETGGQHMEGISLADGALLDEGESGGLTARIATNWVSGGVVFNDILNAVQTDGAVIKITYTGSIANFGMQSDLGGYEEVALDNVTEVDGKNVAIVNCADIVAACPTALGGDFGGWCNIYLRYEGETKLYGFEVVTGYEASAPAAEETAPTEEAPAVEETPVAEEAPAPVAAPAPAKTGVVLAVLPMAMAAAAVVVSKRR